MSADSLMDKYGDQQGWNDDTRLGICLSYIEAQQSDEAFEAHLQEYAATETDEEEEMEEICMDCGKPKKWFMHLCPNNPTAVETYGCPMCDDKCGLCDDNN